ncbi:general secretion pathway protein G [Mariprofundus micogutta]|uniref:General secretion pathway protein G n=1 Tax=Mariprofundus micogutta TaxID=1921010 RepID=A0A1L8CPH6_9PROT|nr:type II secretion system protein [Mariprofundus micogutta]GAV20729.1 general secretion pathway protein G [Mariprofundus micogutta]
MLRSTRKQKGFTLIEMIGVLAVIAILAAIVAPKIFDAIRDAKIDTLVTNLNSIRTSVVDYYKDTSTFPSHDADPTEARTATAPKDLITAPAAGLRGWDGPYLDKELENPVNPSGDFFVIDSATAMGGAATPAGGVSFDLDGDGTADYDSAAAAPARSFVISYAQISGLTVDEARKLSEILDSDMEKVTGASAWWNAGRARVPGAAGGTGVADPRNTAGAAVTMWVYLGSR